MRAPVTIVFFNRPDTLEKVFEKVKQAKPEKLFLVQDGAREGNKKDEEKILACRKIVENIDWQCEVFKNYSDVNLGCGARLPSGLTWVFEHVDRTIILEDDCVPDVTFFSYCDELLEKYKDDSRILYLSGLNHFQNWDAGGADYFFAKSGAIHGWATWARAWKKYDYNVKGLSSEYTQRLLRKQFKYIDTYHERYRGWEMAYNRPENERISFWDFQWGFIKYSQGMLVIIPKNNLITNIGFSDTATHTFLKDGTYKRGKTFVNIPSSPVSVPLIHPDCVICDAYYDEEIERCMYRKSVYRKVQEKAYYYLKRK